jgi:Fe2+ or Zn2+ uptake regulation protein
MTTDRRQIDLVLRVFKELVAAGADGIAPGAINARLREIGEPMGTWTVRGALSTLEADGAIAVDEQTGAWYLADDRAKTRQRSGTA